MFVVHRNSATWFGEIIPTFPRVYSVSKEIMNLLWSNFAIGQIFIEIYGNFCFCGLNNLVTLHRKKIPFKTLLKHLFPFCVVKKYFTCTKQEIGKQNQNIQKYFSSSPANMFQWERKREREKERKRKKERERERVEHECILLVY